MTMTTTLIRPPSHEPTAEEDCGMCSGDGGRWITGDSRTPGRNIREWVPCTGCKGTGKVK